mgnify:CR=1 FL=1
MNSFAARINSGSFWSFLIFSQMSCFMDTHLVNLIYKDCVLLIKVKM